MSLAIPEDAASVLEQFVHDVANTPAEITHLLSEIQAKDIEITAFKNEISRRDNQLQKWVRANGGHVANPKEAVWSHTISDCYDKCEILQAEKCGLSEKALIVLERQIKRLDVGLRGLSAREEFPSDWGGPTLLGGSGTVTGVSSPAPAAGGPAQGGPLQVVSGNVEKASGAPNIANAAQIRMAQQATARPTGSGTQTPTTMARNQREGSSEANKRRRLHATLSNLPTASSNLRQSSLGPGTPKAGTPAPPAGGSTSRAGSVQPKGPLGATQKKAQQPAPGRKLPPTLQAAANRRRERNRPTTTKKPDRRRQLKSDRATPSTNASVSDDEEAGSPSPSSLTRSQHDGAADRKQTPPVRPERDGEAEEEEEEEEEDIEDDNLYCFCQRRSFGEMIGCDNVNCEYQWFHFGCVGLKEQPVGEWLCPTCRRLPRSQVVKSE